VVAAVWSQRVVQILPLLLGLVLLALGLWDSYNGFCSGGKTPLGLPRFAQGILDIMVAMVLILNRGVSVAFLGVVLGLWAAISGLISVRMAWGVRHTYGVPAFIDGGLKLVVGLFMMARPFGGMKAWVAMLGVFAVFTGISIVISTFYWNRPE
ncbi:MAG: DUF308 domain-containing protein, partial [Ruthenibacterium sp.]